MQNTNAENFDNTAPIASATVPEDPWSVPKEVSASVGELLDETAESTKSFMTSVGDQFDTTAESVTTCVKGALPSSKDSAPKSAGEHLDKTTEATKSFMTSVGEQFDKTADSVKGVFPSTADKDPANKEV